MFAALIAALGLPGALYLGGTAVPITFQTLGVMLAGAILGARKGFLSVLLFLVLVAAGLPLLSGGRGGLGVFVGPSVGYLAGWLLGVVVIGWFTARLLPRYRVLPALGATALGGIVAVYLVGVPVFAAITGTPLDVAFLGSLVFLPGDLAKVVVTVLVAKGVHRAWPGLIAPQPWPWRRRCGGVLGRMNDWLRGSSHDPALAFGGVVVRYGELARAVGAARLPAGDGLVGCPAGTGPVAPRHHRARRPRPAGGRCSSAPTSRRPTDSRDSCRAARSSPLTTSGSSAPGGSAAWSPARTPRGSRRRLPSPTSRASTPATASR